MSTFRRVTAILAFMLASLGASTINANPAGAWPWTPSPIVYNQSGGHVPMMHWPSPWGNAKHWIRNSTQFTMICYTDHAWHTGNYRTNRWFYGQSWDTGTYGYVHASYVYYQKSVPRC